MKETKLRLEAPFYAVSVLQEYFSDLVFDERVELVVEDFGIAEWETITVALRDSLEKAGYGISSTR